MKKIELITKTKSPVGNLMTIDKIKNNRTPSFPNKNSVGVFPAKSYESPDTRHMPDYKDKLMHKYSLSHSKNR